MIGILQTASHPALDAVQRGCIQRLKQALGSQVNIVVHNAQGSSNTAQHCAHALHRNAKIRAIVTIGTMATQAACLVEQEKPIIFSAVTNPQKLGINSITITDITNKVDVKKLIEALYIVAPKTHGT